MGGYTMDRELWLAATEGNVKFLKEAVVVQPSEYFLAQYGEWGNIFHAAAWAGSVEFLKEAMNILPKDLQKQLLLQTINDGRMYTVLHQAAYRSETMVVKCINEMYASLSWDDVDHVKPWLALTRYNQTPLNLILRQVISDEKCAMEILLMDLELVSFTIADSFGNSPLYYALRNGHDLVATNILKFLNEAVAVQRVQPPEYFLTKYYGENIFHIAARKGKVEFLKEAMNILPTDILKQLLLTTSDESMYTMLQVAAVVSTDIRVVKCIREMYASLSWDNEDNHVKPWLSLTEENETPLNLALRQNHVDEKCALEILLMDPDFKSCNIADVHGKTPLYYAVEKGLNLVAEKILMSPLPHTYIFGSSSFLELLRLTTTNCSGNVERLLWEKYGGCLDDDGNSLLHSTLNSTSTQELALETLSTYPDLCKLRNNRGESPFFLAVKSGYEQVVDKIMRIDEPRFHMLRRNDGATVLHILSSIPESAGKRLLNKYWWMMNLRDGYGKTALDYANQANAPWLVALLTKPSLLHKEDFDWIEACKRKENLAVFAFVDTCEDLKRECLLKNDTPLHHLKLNSYQDYRNFLKNPAITELKNMVNHDGATALHRALKRKDIDFVKALLLDDVVVTTTRDYHGTTTNDLLAKLCKENDEWDKLCKLINVNPYMKTSYIQEGGNLEQLRSIILLVAALLATITFTAGFTLPGGLNSDTGEALLAKKASFLMFLFADVYAMCTSMLVLSCMIWSMVSTNDINQLFIDRCVFILVQSLWSTLLAFMIGVYTVIAHSSLWAAILIMVIMCLTIGISANRVILLKFISRLFPIVNGVRQDRLRLLEEGSVGASEMERNTSYERELINAREDII